MSRLIQAVKQIHELHKQDPKAWVEAIDVAQGFGVSTSNMMHTLKLGERYGYLRRVARTEVQRKNNRMQGTPPFLWYVTEKGKRLIGGFYEEDEEAGDKAR